MINEWVIVLLLISGCFFFFVGTLGLIRLPDAFTQMHASTKCDTLGAGFVLTALMIDQGWSLVTLKLIIILIIIWTTNPTESHVMAKAAYYARKRRYSDEEL